MHDELLQIVDPITGEPTGEHTPRAELFAKKLWCRTTNIFVLNSKGELLCHRRSLSKERFPGAWSTHFGGHVTKDESFKISALKELGEEIGLSISPHQLLPWRTSRKVSQRIWIRDFLTVYDGSIDDLKLQKEELEEVKWFSSDAITEMLSVDLEDGGWLAGTHDFPSDYQCMRAVLTAGIDVGLFGGDFKQLRVWTPLQD